MDTMQQPLLTRLLRECVQQTLLQMREKAPTNGWEQMKTCRVELRTVGMILKASFFLNWDEFVH